MHILTTKIMLAHILSDERIKEFHLEIYRDNQLPAKIHERVRTMQIEIMKSYGLKLTSEYYYWCAAAEYGARRELIVQNRRLDAESIYFRDLTDLISTITMRIAGLDPVIIDENLEWANQVYQNLKFWHLHMMK